MTSTRKEGEDRSGEWEAAMSPPLDRLLVPSGNDGVMTGHPDSTRDEARSGSRE